MARERRREVTVCRTQSNSLTVFLAAFLVCAAGVFLGASDALAGAQIINFRGHAGAINKSGAVTGRYNRTSGFIREADGVYTFFQVGKPTLPTSINADGATTGVFPTITELTSGGPQFKHDAGFVRSADGTVTTFDIDGQTTAPESINNKGWIAGQSYGPAFVRSPAGKITIFALGASSTAAFSINNLNTTAGAYFDSDFLAHGFIRTADGTVTTVDDPNAGTGANQGTWAYAINDNGAIAGFYFDSSGIAHAYLRTADGTFTTIDPEGAQGAAAFCINKRGSIGGEFYSNGVEYGFIRHPDGRMTNVAVGDFTDVVGINDSGEAVGIDVRNSKERSFVRIP
jgi:hypothetical protein